MADNFKQTLSRQSLADYLENLARGLRQGKVDLEGKAWAVPEEVEADLHFKEKRGRLVLKLKCGWATMPEYKPGAREPIVRWQESFQTVKKRLGARFKEMQQAVAQGRIPDPKVLADFTTDSQTMTRMAEPEWHEAMQSYLEHLAALERAASGRDLAAVQHEMADLHAAMVACHREYK